MGGAAIVDMGGADMGDAAIGHGRRGPMEME